MNGFSETYVRDVMSGARRGPVASLLRLVTAAAEPVYATVVTNRNRRFDSGKLPSVRLERPVISIGNITTGGTGKTPVVQWLADALRARGWRPAILSRGYRSSKSGVADESRMLEESLNAVGGEPIRVRANPDRVAAAAELIAEDPGIDAFLLDDGFQHRRVKREIDLVLVNAAEPFGYGHVLPRGMLREPLKGLARATALVVTRSDEVEAPALAAIERRLKQFNAAAAVFRAAHEQIALIDAAGNRMPISSLRDARFFSFCGIADPAGFERQLARHAPAGLGGSRRFADHHNYSRQDVDSLMSQAKACGAAMLVTTAKDWTKVGPLTAGGTALPIFRVELRIRFAGNDGDRLLGLVDSVLENDARTARKKRLHGGG